MPIILKTYLLLLFIPIIFICSVFFSFFSSHFFWHSYGLTLILSDFFGNIRYRLKPEHLGNKITQTTYTITTITIMKKSLHLVYHVMIMDMTLIALIFAVWSRKTKPTDKIPQVSITAEISFKISIYERSGNLSIFMKLIVATVSSVTLNTDTECGCSILILDETGRQESLDAEYLYAESRI